MPGLASELYVQCRTVLLECREFQSYRVLRSVFIVDQLSPFRSGLPSADSPSELVDQCLEYLLDKRLPNGNPVLPIFLATLRDRYPQGDALRDKLGALVESAQSTFLSSELLPTVLSLHHSEAKPLPETITWLHLSDLHFRESHVYDENVVLRALLRDVAECIETNGLRLDFAVITGDIAFSGKPDEYALAQTFFDNLLATTGLSRGQLFVVPGNHDVDRGLITEGAKLIGAGLADRATVNKLLSTPVDRQLVMTRFKGYAEFVNDYFADHLVFDDEHYFYVQTRDLGRRRVALLGLNSAWLSTSDKDKEHRLVIGERQTREAWDITQKKGAQFMIALLHHPFDWLRGFDQDDSAAILIDNCNFVLHGHLHSTGMVQLVSPDSGAMVIAAGACYETRQHPNSYNFVRLDLCAGTGTVYLRRYSDARGGFWAKDVLTYKNTPDGEYSFALRNLPPPQRSVFEKVGTRRGIEEAIYGKRGEQ